MRRKRDSRQLRRSTGFKANMLKPPHSRAALIFLSGTLAFAGVACTSEKLTTEHHRNVPPIATVLAPSAAPASPESPAPPTSLSHEKVAPYLSQPNPYELALEKAYGAFSISQYALSSDEWNLVVNQWTDAIALLKAVPVTSPYNAIAQAKLAEYQRHLTYAQQRATRPTDENPNSVVAVIPETPTHPRGMRSSELHHASSRYGTAFSSREHQLASLSASGSAALPAPPDVPPQPVFEATIKRRAGGTPVIDVTFNGTQQFEMIVDTGASGTVITQETADALGVVPVGKAKANTVSDTVEFPIGYVDSISVGDAVVTDVPVAIATSVNLETGLLGHDFFGDYDVTIKRDVVEFRPR